MRILYVLLLAIAVLPARADPGPENQNPEPLVFQVIRKRDTRQLASLLAADASTVIKTRGPGGASPLHIAASQDDAESLQLLIGRGAVVDTPAENGATPLHWAANCNAAAATGILIENGANVNARTARDFTPLHWAALGNATNVIVVLLEHGAAPMLRNDEGKTPLDLAKNNKKDRAVALLSYRQPTVDSTKPASPARHWWTFWRKSPAEAKSKSAETKPIEGKPQPAAAVAKKETPATEKAVPASTNRHSWAFWRKTPAPTPQPAREVAQQPDPGAPPAAVAPKTVKDETTVAPPAGPVFQPPTRVDTVTPRIPTATVAPADRPAGEAQIVTFKDGSAYEGQMLNGAFEGSGTLMLASGDMYAGQWKNGQREGVGEYAFANGERYKGEWVGGRMWGKGVYTFSTGDSIEGTWQNNSLLKGQGSFRFSNGDIYTGEWQRDRPWGKGIYACADGRKFAGHFVNSRFVGANLPASGTESEPAPAGGPTESR